MIPADDTPIADLHLSVATENACDRAGILTCGQARAKSDLDLLRTRNFGRVRVEELRRALDGRRQCSARSGDALQVRCHHDSGHPGDHQGRHMSWPNEEYQPMNHIDYSPAQLRALATISEATKHSPSRWRPVHQPPDMTWVDYVDASGKIGQCCRNGDGWRQAPIGEDPVFLVYSPPPSRR